MNLESQNLKRMLRSGSMIVVLMFMYYAASMSETEASIWLDKRVESNFYTCIAKPGFEALYRQLEDSDYRIVIVPTDEGDWNGHTYPDDYKGAVEPGVGSGSLIKWRHKGQGPPMPWSCDNECPKPGPPLIVEDTDRCATLFHEMTHARMNEEGKRYSEYYEKFGYKDEELLPRYHPQFKDFPCKYRNKQGEVKELTTPMNEVVTTRAENEYRRLNDLFPRCCYGRGYPLPENGEECEEPEKSKNAKPKDHLEKEHPDRRAQDKAAKKSARRSASNRSQAERQRAPDQTQPGSLPSPTTSPVAPTVPQASASSLGDPHLFTFDGMDYDFQAAGEFTALRSESGDMVIQVRQVPWRDSRWVSVNSAIAVKVNEDRLTIEYAQESLVLRINRASTTLSERRDLSAGGFIMPHGGGYLIGWPDGSLLRVLRNVRGVDTSVYLTPERAGTVHGLLGPFTNKPGEMLETKDGKPIRKEDIMDYHKLYRTFGESWRINQAESLFDYSPGTSTATYQKPDFPDPNPPKLAATAEASARDACLRAGVPERAQAGCILDVAMTGEAGFAMTTAAAMRPLASIPRGTDQNFSINIDDHVAVDKPGKGAGRIEVAGAIDRYTFTAAPGTLVYVKSEPPCTKGDLRWGIQDAAGAWVSQYGDVVKVCDDIGRTLLKDGGTYTITVKGSDDATGDYGFALQAVAADQRFTNLSGDWDVLEGSTTYRATLDRNGNGPYTFQGGQFTTTSFKDGRWHGTWRQTANDRDGEFELMLSQDGSQAKGDWWYLRVGNRSNIPPRQEGGTFVWKRLSAGAGQNFAINIGEYIAPDKPTRGAGRIEKPGDIDRYTFTAPAGTLVNLIAESPCTHKELRWNVRDANNNLVSPFEYRSICDDIGQLLLKEGGRYSITVSGAGEGTTGMYRFGLLSVKPK